MNYKDYIKQNNIDMTPDIWTEFVDLYEKKHFADEYQIADWYNSKINKLLQKQREDIQDKLNKHWNKLESNDYDFKDMEDWRIFKCIRNNNNDVIKQHDKSK